MAEQPQRQDNGPYIQHMFLYLASLDRAWPRMLAPSLTKAMPISDNRQVHWLLQPHMRGSNVNMLVPRAAPVTSAITTRPTLWASRGALLSEPPHLTSTLPIPVLPRISRCCRREQIRTHGCMPLGQQRSACSPRWPRWLRYKRATTLSSKRPLMQVRVQTNKRVNLHEPRTAQCRNNCSSVATSDSENNGAWAHRRPCDGDVMSRARTHRRARAWIPACFAQVRSI